MCNIILFFKDNDNVQKIKSLLLSIIEFIKIILACLLSIFVPQNCFNYQDHKNGCYNNTICQYSNYYPCSIYDNFIDLSTYNIFVIVFNFICLFIFFVTYIIEIKREYFLINSFDSNKELPDEYLHKIIDKYPIIKKKLSYYNIIYNKLCISLYVIFCVNWIFSAVLIFHYFYLDFTTISTMVCNFLLVIGKLHSGYVVSYTSKKTPAISSQLTENLIFNVIDKNIISLSDDNINNLSDIQIIG